VVYPKATLNSSNSKLVISEILYSYDKIQFVIGKRTARPHKVVYEKQEYPDFSLEKRNPSVFPDFSTVD
jgi:hypothetical protein